MAFTMSQVKRKTPSKQDDIKSCYHLIYSNDLLTDNVKYGIWQYCNYRFTKRNRGRFTAAILQTMIEELLDKTCYKQYKEISFLDVDKNENEILYHVKRAIHYGATRSLYYEQAAEYNMSALDNLKVDLNPPKQERLTTDEVKDYFGDLFI